MVDGLHEAFVSEEVWEQAQVKVAAQAKKYEKVNRDKKEKIHLLSGILKCPVCGAGMYGNKVIKKRKDGSNYKDFYYYGCKHRNMIRGHKCDYKKQVHAHSVVDITRMPGWVRDHSVMRMGIVLKETDTLIGYCHIDHRTEDMSAWLSINIGEKSARGKGIGTEVVQILLRYCFMVLGVYSVHLDVLETNTPAIKCYEKAGFRISGRYRGHCYYMRNHYDWLHMDILYDEYLKIHV